MKESIQNTLYQVGVKGIDGIGMLRVLYAAEPMYTEAHDDCFELLYMISGEKSLTVSGQTYLLRGGDMLVIRPRERHGNTKDVQNRSNMMYIFCASPLQTEGFLGLDGAQREQLTKRLMQMRVLRPGHRARQMLDEISAMISRKQEGDAFFVPALSALFVLLFRELLSGDGAGEVPPPEDIEQVINYILDTPDVMPSSRELAELIGLSEARFKVKFKQHVGIPPAEYVARTHIALAQESLRGTQDSMTQIAMRFGFSSSQHFSTLFKRYFGMTPTAYRAQKEKV